MTGELPTSIESVTTAELGITQANVVLIDETGRTTFALSDYTDIGAAIDAAFTELDNNSNSSPVGEIWLPYGKNDIGSQLAPDTDIGGVYMGAPNATPAQITRGEGGVLFNSNITNGNKVIDLHAIADTANNDKAQAVYGGFAVLGNGSEGDGVEFSLNNQAAALNIGVKDVGGDGIVLGLEEAYARGLRSKNNSGLGIRVAGEQGPYGNGTGFMQNIEVEQNSDDGINIQNPCTIMGPLEVENNGDDGIFIDGQRCRILGHQTANITGHNDGINIKTGKAIVDGVDLSGNDNSVHVRDGKNLIQRNRMDPNNGGTHIDIFTGDYNVIRWNDYLNTGNATAVNVQGGANDTLIIDPGLSPSDISDSGTRTVFNGRYLNPPTFDLAGSGTASISPSDSFASVKDLYIDGAASTTGGTATLQAINGIAHEGATVHLWHTGDDTITLQDESNNSVTNGLALDGGTNATLDANGDNVRLQYRTNAGAWVQTGMVVNAA